MTKETCSLCLMSDFCAAGGRREGGKRKREGGREGEGERERDGCKHIHALIFNNITATFKSSDLTFLTSK